MDAILPAAGEARRMRGIPKFLLPCDNSYSTLIEVHIGHLLEICNQIWIPTRPEFVLLLTSLGFSKDRIHILPMETKSMTETVANVMKISSSSHFQLVMPDTFFSGEIPYNILKFNPEFADLACWKIREEQKGKLGQVLIENDQITDITDKSPSCEYSYAWGSLTFSRKLMNFAELSDPHIGYSLKKAIQNGEFISAKIIDGEYYDCGTPKEYILMLTERINFE